MRKLFLLSEIWLVFIIVCLIYVIKDMVWHAPYQVMDALGKSGENSQTSSNSPERYVTHCD